MILIEYTAAAPGFPIESYTFTATGSNYKRSFNTKDNSISWQINDITVEDKQTIHRLNCRFTMWKNAKFLNLV